MTTALRSKWIAVGVIATGQMVLAAIAFMRLQATRASAVGADDCLACQAMTLLQHEAGIWAILWGLLLLATLRWRLLRLGAVTGLLALLLLLLTDLLVLQQFGLRLYLADLLTYGQQPRFVVEYLAKLPWWRWLPLLVALLAFTWALNRAASRHLAQAGARLTLTVLVAMSVLLHALPDQAAHPLPWTYQNLLEANQPSGADQPFSRPYLEDLTETPPPALTDISCRPGLGHRANVIIVAVESWSWYHSSLLLPDSMRATPTLDRFARGQAWWDQFHANGFTTDHGLIALLAGQLPVPAVNRYRSLDVFAGYAGDWRTLPRRLKADGYHTAFLTSGHLGFLGKGEWLESLGFDHIEGHEQSAYEGAPRYQFAAVSDDRLYQRAINWMQRDRPREQPFAAFIETVTTHPPFTDPATGQSNEAAAFRFADAALGDFIAKLEQADYFNDGLLLITSDQRALTPLRASELEHFGTQAGGRLPLIMAGNKLPLTGRQTTPGQMLDLPYSLDYYLTDEACRLPGQGNLFTGEAPGCIYQADGNRRSIIHAFCGDHHAEIRMDGDDTRVIEGFLPNADARIRALNFQRARLGVQEINAHNVL